MRRLRLVFACLALAPLLHAASAQTAVRRFGFTAGVNAATVSGSSDNGASRRAGVMGGVFLHIPVSPSVAFQPELVFTMKGAKTASSIGSGTVKVDYVEIPLLLRAAVPVSGKAKPFFFAGPALAMRGSCRFEGEIAGTPFEVSCDQSETEGGSRFKMIDYSVVAGGGVAFDVAVNRLSVGLRYDQSLSNFIDDGDAKHRVLSLVMSFEFPWKD